MIAVIMILMSILLPALSTAREEGRAAVCTTKMDQIFHASFSYTIENDDRLPYFAWLDGRPDPSQW